MKIQILTLFPEMFPGTLGHSLAGKALEKGLWSLNTIQIRDFATDKHKTVDEKSYGGGTGLVMKADVVGAAIDHALEQSPGATLIYPTPRGVPFTQELAHKLVKGHRETKSESVGEPAMSARSAAPCESQQTFTGAKQYIPPPAGGRLGGGQGAPSIPTEARSYPLENILKNARDLRKNLTDAEQKLWYTLRRQNLGVKFRRQHPLGKYVADFACLDPKLIIELDGGQHNEESASKYDKKRTEFLESQGFEVLRFWNNQVMQEFEGVLELIHQKLYGEGRPLPNPPPGGEGINASLIFLCGRYEGVDQRVLDKYQPLEVSLGDYVLSGAELAAQVILDACLRLIPGVISTEEAAADESFSSKNNYLLEYPQYSHPPSWQGLDVPEVLLSGNHQRIAEWRAEQSLAITKKRRPDLLNK